MVQPQAPRAASILLTALLLTACSGGAECSYRDQLGMCPSTDWKPPQEERITFSLHSESELTYGIAAPLVVTAHPTTDPRLTCYPTEPSLLEVDRDCRSVTSRMIVTSTITIRAEGGVQGMVTVRSVAEARWASPSGDAASVASSITMVRGRRGFSLGSNATGMLGTNDADPSTIAPLPVPVLTAQGGTLPLKQVAQGGERAAAIDASGQVWVWGSADQGSGTTATRTMYGATRVMTIPGHSQDSAVQIAASSDSVAIVMANGRMLGWGLRSGTVNEARVMAFPALVLAEDGTPLTGMRAVRAGWRSMGALDDRGRVWVWGLRAGPNGEDQQTARLVRTAEGAELTGIVSLAFGAGHLLAVTADGRLYAAGDNESGQLGQGAASAPLRGAVLVRDASGAPLANVAMAAASAGVSLAQLTDGRVLAWGSATTAAIGCGQSGCGNVGEVQATPRPVVSPSGDGELAGIVSIQASHAAVYALAGDGAVYAWGAAGPGLGPGVPVSTDQYVPAPMVGENGPLKLDPLSCQNLTGAMR